MKQTIYFLFIALAFTLLSCGAKSKTPQGILFQNEIAELAESTDGRKVFRFTDGQKAAIASVNKKYHTLSIAVTLKKRAEMQCTGAIRFYLLSGGNAGGAIVADAALLGEKSLTLSICTMAMPDGFCVEAGDGVEIASVDAVESQVGWINIGDTQFYGFGTSGGTVRPSFTSADFTSARGYFSTSAGTYASIIYSPSSKQGSLNVSVGGERFLVQRHAKQLSTTIPSSAVNDIFQGIAFDDASAVAGCVLRFNPKIDKQGFAAVKSDAGLIPDWAEARWRNRDYEVFSWEEFPNVLIFDTRNYDVQDDFFRRLAYFAEKRGYVGTLVSDRELSGKHGYNAHDYRSETLANFFNKATAENFPLNEKELLLKSILLTNGILVQEGQSVKATNGALISISRDSPEYLRWQFLNHEGFHGVFFTHEEFRDKMRDIYNTMDYKSLEFVKAYYRVSPELDYDTNDLYLMQNELMAYTIQHRVQGVASYYKNLASRAHVQKAIPELASYVLDTNAAGFTAIAKKIDAFVYENYGLNAGRVYLITRQ